MIRKPEEPGRGTNGGMPEINGGLGPERQGLSVDCLPVNAEGIRAKAESALEQCFVLNRPRDDGEIAEKRMKAAKTVGIKIIGELVEDVNVKIYEEREAHMRLVPDICRDLAPEAFEELGEDEANSCGLTLEGFTELVGLAGVLHDVGRLNESDPQKNPEKRHHTDLGMKYLFDDGHIRDFSDYPQFDAVLRAAVANHSVFEPDYEEIRQEAGSLGVVLTKAVRDADKIATIEGGTKGWARNEDLPLKIFGSRPSPAVLQAFEDKRMVRHEDCERDSGGKKNGVDTVLTWAAFGFDLNYRAGAERLMTCFDGRNAFERLCDEVVTYTGNSSGCYDGEGAWYNMVKEPIERAFMMVQGYVRRLANGFGADLDASSGNFSQRPVPAAHERHLHLVP